MYRLLKSPIFFLLFMTAWTYSQAQGGANGLGPDHGKSVAEIEKELSLLARDILTHDDMDYKIEANKQFISRFTELLKRPESYDHDFDSLVTISRLTPEDNSFRIFTWHLVEKEDPNAYYSENAHYYFGLIQRKHIDPAGKTHYIIIPLMELEQLPRGFESVVTDNYAWFGALYYQPKGEDHVLAYDGYYYKLVPQEGKVEINKGEKEQVITYIPGKFKGRTLTEVDKVTYSNHKRVKESIRYYTLMGWNGWDNKSNYKVLEVLSFDPQDSTRAVFGAPIFYFDMLPKARAIFKYSDFSHFTMNVSHVRRGPFKMFRKQMVVYDHLAIPNHANATEKYELGPDGTYDAVAWFGKYGGYFEWYRDVEIADRYETKRHRKEMIERQMETAANDTATFPDYIELSSRRQQRKMAKANKRILAQQKKDSERRMKEAGLEMKRREED